MLARGIEPPQGCPHMNLNHARLPIPPREHIEDGRNEAAYAKHCNHDF